MNITIKATGLDMTPALKEYVEEKIGGLEKFIAKFDENNSVIAAVEVARSSNHHKKGDVFYAEVSVNLPHRVLRAEDEDFDVRVAIGKVKEKLQREIVKYKETL